MTDLHLFARAGLLLDLAGSLVLISSVVVSKQAAIELGRSYFSGESEEENLKLPGVRDRLRQNRLVKIGGTLPAFGFLGQFIGTWAR